MTRRPEIAPIFLASGSPIFHWFVRTSISPYISVDAQILSRLDHPQASVCLVADIGVIGPCSRALDNTRTYAHVIQRQPPMPSRRARCVSNSGRPRAPSLQRAHPRALPAICTDLRVFFTAGRGFHLSSSTHLFIAERVGWASL